MERIILILGDKTEDIRLIVDTHYKTSVSVIDAFSTPTEFYDKYKTNPVRVDRIIVFENSFLGNPVIELTNLRNMLDSHFFKFGECSILIGTDKEISETVDFIREDYVVPEMIQVYSHERYSHGLIIDYILRKVARKYFVEEKAEYQTIIRKRINSKDTFKLEEDEEIDNDGKLIVMDTNTVAAKDIQNKLSALSALSEAVKDQKWHDNPIIRDLSKWEIAKEEFQQQEIFEFDYSIFQSASSIRNTKNNLFLITGEKRSGKTCTTYALGKSGSVRNKVLLIDLDLISLGLSYIAESASDESTVFLLQNFREDFKNTVYTLANSDTNLNVIAGNTKTLSELGDLDIPSLISLIISSCSKYFDKVLLDIPIDYLPQYISILRTCEKLIITTPTSITQVTSLIRGIMESPIRVDILSRDIVVIPNNVFRDIRGIKTLRRSSIRKILADIIPKGLSVLPELEIKSFNLDDSLYLSIDGIKEGEVL